jgi:competence protein ComEA
MVRPARMILALFLLLVSSFALAEPININTADAATLAAGLQGIGMSKAEAIVAYRTEHGPFQKVDDLAQVKGIGDKILEANRTNLTIGQVPSTAAK